MSTNKTPLTGGMDMSNINPSSCNHNRIQKSLEITKVELHKEVMGLHIGVNGRTKGRYGPPESPT